MNDRIFQGIIASVLILLFCYAAISKLLNVEDFARELANQEVPIWSRSILVWSIPGGELLVSVLLSISRTRLLGLYGSCLLMTIFTVYVGLVVYGFFDRVPCSCGGVISGMDFQMHLLFNAFFLTLSVIGIFMFHRNTNQP